MTQNGRIFFMSDNKHKGKEEELTEGIAKGLAESITKIARKMKQAGKTVSAITELTGLPIEEIEQL